MDWRASARDHGNPLGDFGRNQAGWTTPSHSCWEWNDTGRTTSSTIRGNVGIRRPGRVVLRLVNRHASERVYTGCHHPDGCWSGLRTKTHCWSPPLMGNVPLYISPVCQPDISERLSGFVALAPHQRALALYEDARPGSEELPRMACPTFWNRARFMDIEITKVSNMMGDLFKRRRKQDQSVRDFNVEFERLVLRLEEVQCEIPPLIKG